MSGSSKGKFITWSDTNSIKENKQLHNGAIDTITVTKDKIFTGGRDMLVNVLDPV